MTPADLERRLDQIERNQIALANSLRNLLARVDTLEDEDAALFVTDEAE
jgi:hypothetical protein